MSPYLDSPFIRDAGELWTRATTSPFLDEIATGRLPREAFERWLVQDYHFARGLMVYQAVMVAKSPRPHQGVLIGGLAALDSELGWFESHAGARRLDLGGDVHPVCRRYTDFLIRTAHTEPFPVLAAVLFGVEVSYLHAWSAMEPAGPYAEFIERWSSPPFREYVDSLAAMAERTRTGEEQASFRLVLEHEREFWSMSYEG